MLWVLVPGTTALLTTQKIQDGVYLPSCKGEMTFFLKIRGPGGGGWGVIEARALKEGSGESGSEIWGSSLNLGWELGSLGTRRAAVLRVAPPPRNPPG